MFLRGSSNNNSPRSIQLDEIRLSNSSFEHLLRSHEEEEAGQANNGDSNSLTYELGFEDEVKVYDYDSSCSETSSVLERRLAGLSFGVMFPVALVFGPCMSKGCRRLKRRFMMRFGKHFGRRPGVSRKSENSQEVGLLGVHHDIDGSTARTTGADCNTRGSREIHLTPTPYRPVTMNDVERSKVDWKENDKKEWKRRRTTMVPRDF